MLNVYMAGAISEYNRLKQLNKAKAWRIKASNFFIENINNVEIFDPSLNFEKNFTYNSKGVVLQNIKYLRESNLLLLNLEYLEKSPGTMFEIVWAYLNGVVVISFGKLDNSLEFSPHVEQCIDMTFDDLDKALEYVYDMYNQ